MTFEWSGEPSPGSLARERAAMATEQAGGAWEIRLAFIGWWLQPAEWTGIRPVWALTERGLLRRLSARATPSSRAEP
jgi:hypothetical protein